MKIKLSKSQWEQMGKTAGWMKKEAIERPGGVISDRSLESIPPLVKQLQSFIHGIIDPNIKQSLNIIIAKPLNDLSMKLQEYQKQNVGFKPQPAQSQPTAQSQPATVAASIKSIRVVEAKKGKAVNPWAVCHTTVDKKKDPEKYEKCVKEVKKEHPIKKD